MSGLPTTAVIQVGADADFVAGAVSGPWCAATFAYVEADGSPHLGSGSVISNTNSAGDVFNVTNVAGSFGLLPYSAADYSTQMATSGCAQ